MLHRVSLVALLLLCACSSPESEMKVGDVNLKRLSNVDNEPGQWLSLGRGWQADRFSPLERVNDQNVAKLGFAWEAPFRSHRGRVEHGHESTPIVVDGVMYVSGPWGSVLAVDAKTGAQRWRYDPQVDGSYNRRACCDVVNRGLQVWEGKIYVGILDGHLVSLDAKTGVERWRVDTLIDRDKRSYTITGPAQIAKNVVVIGNSGGEYGVRGYVTAYDLETGKQMWRFYTVPGDPAKAPPEHPEMEMALKTWDPNSHWESGLGGTVWGEMAYDPELNLLYVGTGNSSPYPIWYRSPSGGDNLFLSSILAINPDTGRLAWHYQNTPGEIWDYTSTQNMILADLKIGADVRKVIMQAPKNGFYYVLDRQSGEFISAKPIVFVNWASEIDAKGRPVFNPQAVYKDKTAVVFPSGSGAHNWHPMAFSRDTGLAYIPARQQGMVISNVEGYEWHAGGNNTGSAAVFSFLIDFLSPEQRKAFDALLAAQKGLPPFDTQEMLIAWDPVTQTERWRVPRGNRDFAGGGVLTTAGNLVVQGTGKGFLEVYSADKGQLLKSIEVGTGIMAAPMSYEVDGEQYIAVLAGFGGAMAALHPQESAPYRYQNYGRLLAFKLDGAATPLPPQRQKLTTPAPPALADFPETDARRGAGLFGARCAMCHGARGEQRLSAYPDLFRLTPETHRAFDSIVRGGVLSANGMASFADVLSEDDVKAIHAFLVHEQARLRQEEQQPAGE
jgi:quinohemoprotein ethanol dehydrogenase